jgi:hypothetical protein
MSSSGVKKTSGVSGSRSFGVSRKKFSDFTRHISIGTALTGKVIDDLGDDQYVVNFRGFNFFAESKKSLNKGEPIEGEVEQIDPKVVVKLVPPRLTINSDDSAAGGHRINWRV